MSEERERHEERETTQSLYSLLNACGLWISMT